MGLGLGMSRWSYPEKYKSRVSPASIFRLVRHKQLGDNLVVEIVYPTCKNYEGKKILVFLDTLYAEILKQTSIDPHFRETGLSPFARFEPTEKGFQAAIEFLKFYSKRSSNKKT